ncbi:hypothetical protein [Salinibaculum rarum]|uniref:hypothetical protein n=1 Tax=Salinibaculum rarum TaxID=3058903 RepID=UPI00265FD9A7|nr:hypothetical protein [Salinibaculum sp. KK48]
MQIQDVKSLLPDKVAAQTVRPTARTELLSVPFHSEDYYIRVFTARNARLHRWLTWWRNYVSSKNEITTPVFHGHATPEAFATYQYEALRDVFGNGGWVASPVTVATGNGLGVVVTERADTDPGIESTVLGSDQFLSVLRTVKTFHMNGYIHNDLPRNIFQKTATSRLVITNPVGDFKSGRAPAAEAYDLICLMALFTPTLGAWAVAHRVYDEYPLETFEQLIPMAKTLKKTQSRTDNWAVQRTANAIAEVLYEETGQTPAGINFDPDSPEETVNLAGDA